MGDLLLRHCSLNVVPVRSPTPAPWVPPPDSTGPTGPTPRPPPAPRSGPTPWTTASRRYGAVATCPCSRLPPVHPPNPTAPSSLLWSSRLPAVTLDALPSRARTATSPAQTSPSAWTASATPACGRCPSMRWRQAWGHPGPRRLQAGPRRWVAGRARLLPTLRATAACPPACNANKSSP